MPEPQRDITRTFLALLFVGALIGTSLWILRPFLGAAIWAVTIVVATWPLMISIQGGLWGRRSLAVAIMTVVLLCVLVLPLWLAIGTIVSNGERIVGWVKSLSSFELPPPPAWLERLPLFGGDMVTAWQKIAVEGVQDFVKKLAPYGAIVIRWFATQVGGFGVLVLQFLLTVVFAALLYARGERAASWVHRFARRDPHGGDVHAGNRSGRCGARTGPCGRLGLLEPRHGLGNLSPSLDRGGRNHGQLLTPHSDQERCGSSPAARFCGGGRRVDCIRHHRHLRWAGGACCGAQAFIGMVG
jgi:hypothetical protein